MVETRGRRGRESGELFCGGRVSTCKMEKFWRSAIANCEYTGHYLKVVRW